MSNIIFIMSERSVSERLLKRALCLCLVIPFCGPEGLKIFLPFSWNMLVLSVGTVLLLVVIVLKRIKKCYLYIGIFYLVILASTVINSGNAFVAVCYAARMICFIILIDLYVRCQELRLLISTFKLVLGAEILLTLFFQIYDQDIFGYTVSRNYVNFLTSDNFLGYWYLPFTMIVYLSNVRRSRRYQIIDFIFWVSVCISSLIMAWSATCMAIYILFVLLISFRKMKVFTWLTPFRSLLINIGISVLVIFFQIQNLFSWLIVDILHKDLTLSFRTYIWASTIHNILRKPILGYGTTEGGRMEINRIAGGIYHFSHNIFLEIVIQGGLIALFSYIIMHFAAGEELKRYPQSDAIVFINLAVFCVLLMQFSEFALYGPFANLPLILCFFYKALLRDGFVREPIGSIITLHRKHKT